jgi:serine O-acetyltransferase
MFENLKEDLRRYGPTTAEQVRAILFVPGMWAIIGYRFCRWIYTTRLWWPLRKLLNLVATLVDVWVKVATNIELPAGASIGPGLLIAHNGYIVLASDVVLGRHCTLTQGVTIGHAGGGSASLVGAPIVGDRVYVGPGAAIIGAITVGDDALIGVNAVVNKTVPSRGVVVGNPGRVVSYKGSFKLISFVGMEDDPSRREALAEADSSLLVESTEPKCSGRPNEVSDR